ncbi:TetR family transcriptional regulator [Modestobacter sp. I12A-02628]|uniref:TetR/AcrR family transcriptional regulator n=1 Tax=Goekera deserti TaxID=2497753 RepID=A0A7K3WC16_9ACTN|nr:TetR/AcrR family transcriptional regulator [Goekera deserti]MPQ98301.1 TetR family transcriptional regulator [Goekera deserti]NDI48128.1 TetR family transcriptional regulator [Goekera deserti]NEL53877.1 TetR/AcrR family transcriptional regulator [Goekera deserti]
MVSPTAAENVRPNRGGRPRDPSRDGVIRAAILRLLADSGYAALTMDAVASEAGVGKATIYRRWRTKSDLVVDTISEVNRTEALVPDTGSLEGDLRMLLHALVTTMNSPLGSATVSLLSTLPHQPALAAAFRNGPLGQWTHSFNEVWAQAERRGEVAAGQATGPVPDVASAMLVQRWLLTGDTVDDDYADLVLEQVVMPLVRSATAAQPA